MKRHRFGRSVVLAALLGAAWPAFAVVAAPLLGVSAALSLYVVGAIALYVAAIAPGIARGIAAALLSVVIAVGFAVVVGTSGAAVYGAAVALGVARSGLLYRSRSARALAVEALLLGGGLLLARFLFAPGALGTALALWGFFLVQSAFFAIGGVRVRDAHVAAPDRFECARRRALALLDERA
jgi:hypothetical protein